MYVNTQKDNIQKVNGQSNMKSKFMQNLIGWMTKIGQGLNAEQQSYYK